MTTHGRKLLQYDASGLWDIPGGLSKSQFMSQADRAQAARDEVLVTDMQLFEGQTKLPPEKDPLDAGFLTLPERLLKDYQQDKNGSEVGQILRTANRLSQIVDRVVVLGIGGSYMGARALMESCCLPYFNELSRKERRQHPRMVFGGAHVDNDETQGLLRLLNAGPDSTVDTDWGVVVISKSGGTLETAAAFRQMVSALQQRHAGNAQRVAERIVPVTGTGKLSELADALGCTERYPVPDGVGGRFSVLSAVGLLPAALLGIDIIQLLEGACAMNEKFRQAPFGSNPVLDYAAVGQYMERHAGRMLRLLSVWASSLESVGLWYDQLFAESLGKHGRGATPLTVVNTRDLHSRAQQHQEGARDKLITNRVVEAWREPPLPVGECGHNQDGLDSLKHATLPELMSAAIRGTNESYAMDERPTATICLPRVDAYHVGQLLQMLMLATVVEGRMMGINPYGQPGVEGYKKIMRRELGL
ncbi:MAG: glucose-6-phosphate isomerase [Planctomycetota bacterium]|nr:glucose-6-phosphate isomerase [Planctomycetota bacterium]